MDFYMYMYYFPCTSMCGSISDSWDISSTHRCSLTVTSPHLCSICRFSLSEPVCAGSRVCEDSRCIMASAMSSTSWNSSSSLASIVLWWLQARWKSSMTELREELAPAAHWSLWDILNCWLEIFSTTLEMELAKCSERTWREEKHVKWK